MAAAFTAKLGARKAADGCVGTGRVAVHRQKSQHLFVCAIRLKDGLLPNPVGTFFGDGTLRKRIAQANFKLAAMQRLFSVAPRDIKLALLLLWLLCQKGRRRKNKAQRIDLEQLRLELFKGID